MSVYVSVQNRGTISLPAASRKRYHLDEPGAQVEVIEEEGQIVLRPKLPVDASQAWFWNKEWLEGERQADAEAAARLGESFDSGEDFLDSLPD
jgi:bifunctional DNA-binding transcriptional regulator/antitoxin component of YhaV-PrlF toxin-antitoxin module